MSSAQKPQRGIYAWWNGKITPVADIRISPFAHGLHYGTGAFEGIRAYTQIAGGGAVFRLTEHIQRWIESFKILGFELPYSREQLVAACLEACKANQFEECYLRPIAFLGDGPVGVDPGAKPPIDVAVLTWIWGQYVGEGTNGARLKISSHIRPHVNSVMTKGKICGQYVNGTIAKREAKTLGYDEALMLDPEGYLTEGTGENLFIVHNGVVKTTPPTSILKGITRDTVLAYFKHNNIECVEMRFTRDELWCADEIFLTGTAAEVTPVCEVDGRVIGFGDRAGKVGPATAKLRNWFEKMVRGDLPPYGKTWLTPIR